MRIVVLDGWLVNPGDIDWEPLAALGELTVYEDSSHAQAMERAKTADAVLLNRTVLDREILEAAEGLRYVGLFSTGNNNVDMAAARRLGITVCNVPSYSTAAVSQHTIALLLQVTNAVSAFNADVKSGNWEGALGLAHPMVELHGKTFGAIGFGEIGRATGRIAAALGMRVLATGSRPSEEGRRIGEYVDMDTLLARSDVVSLHCPLKEETAGIINAGTLEKMRDGAILLNTARGGLLVEKDVAAALKSGKLYAAAVDVVDGEPVQPDNPLLAAPNCIITPHVAWVPPETRARLLNIAAENLRRFMEGQPQNVV